MIVAASPDAHREPCRVAPGAQVLPEQKARPVMRDWRRHPGMIPQGAVHVHVLAPADGTTATTGSKLHRL